MKSAKASLAAMSKTLTHMGKTMRQERKLEAQENERQGRMRDLKIAAEILDLRHASPRSRRIVFTGFNEYWRVIGKHSQPELESKLDPSVPGLLLSDIVERPVAWLWQDYLPLGALTLLEGEPGSGASLLALHIAACVTSGHALPGGATGQGMAAGDAGGDMQGEQGGAGAGFAFEQGEGAQREVVLPEPGDGALDDVGEQETRNGGVEFRLKLRLGVLADDAPVFVEAGEDDAAGARAGVSQIQDFGGDFEVSHTPLALVFLSLEFAFLTHGFTHVCQGFGHGSKGGLGTFHRGFFFHGDAPFGSVLRGGTGGCSCQGIGMKGVDWLPGSW